MSKPIWIPVAKPFPDDGCGTWNETWISPPPENELIEIRTRARRATLAFVRLVNCVFRTESGREFAVEDVAYWRYA